MNIVIKGSLQKTVDSWVLSIGLIPLMIEDSSSLRCLRRLEDIIRKELNDEKIKCLYRIDDNGHLELVLAESPALVDLIIRSFIDLSNIKVDLYLD